MAILASSEDVTLIVSYPGLICLYIGTAHFRACVVVGFIADFIEKIQETEGSALIDCQGRGYVLICQLNAQDLSRRASMMFLRRFLTFERTLRNASSHVRTFLELLQETERQRLVKLSTLLKLLERGTAVGLQISHEV